MTAAELYEAAKYFFPPPPLPEFSIDYASSATSGCGVYFLYEAEVLVYVGESLCVRARLMNHDHRRIVTHFSVIECDRLQRKRLEAFYIGVLNPRLNKESSHRVTRSDVKAKSFCTSDTHCRSPNRSSLSRKIYSFIKSHPGCSLTDCRRAGGWKSGANKARYVIGRMVEFGFVREEVVHTPGRAKRIYFAIQKVIA